MPVFALHGFRWPRTPIRHHVILNNVDDAAPDYIMSSTSPDALRASFTEKWPDIMAHLPNLQFIEMHDPTDCRQGSNDQPYAYVADRVEIGALDADLHKIMNEGLGITNEEWQAMGELRDIISPGERIGWFAVWNGDVERKGIESSRPDDAERTSKVRDIAQMLSVLL